MARRTRWATSGLPRAPRRPRRRLPPRHRRPAIACTRLDTLSRRPAAGAGAGAAGVVAAAPSAGLRDSVSSLVHAMAAFEGGDSAPAGNTPKLDLAAALKGANVSASVGQMADLLKRFDADGKLLSGSTTAAPGDATLRLNALHHSGGAGFLATPQK